jgi:quercetin dioxygenase-like cupin family protein
MIRASDVAAPEDDVLVHRVGLDGVHLRWLVNGVTRDSPVGSVGVMELEPGAVVPLHRHARDEVAVFVLEGTPVLMHNAQTTPAVPGSALLASPATWHGVTNHGAMPCRLLVVFGTTSSAADLDWQSATGEESPHGPPARIVAISKIPETTMHDPSEGRHRISARWLFDNASHGATSLVLGQCTFATGSRHDVHRHPGGDEFLYVYEGTATHLTETSAEPQIAGELLLVHRGEWHGLGGPERGTVRAIFGLLGCASFDEAGYQLYRSAE